MTTNTNLATIEQSTHNQVNPEAKTPRGVFVDMVSNIDYHQGYSEGYLKGFDEGQAKPNIQDFPDGRFFVVKSDLSKSRFVRDASDCNLVNHDYVVKTRINLYKLKKQCDKLANSPNEVANPADLANNISVVMEQLALLCGEANDSIIDVPLTPIRSISSVDVTEQVSNE